jgi:hypothetical protein
VPTFGNHRPDAWKPENAVWQWDKTSGDELLEGIAQL